MTNATLLRSTSTHSLNRHVRKNAPRRSSNAEVYSRVEEITPEYAAKILRTRNYHNRSMNRGRIARYAAAMKAGQWHVNNVCIAFDKNGMLLDGQNRLKAVVEAQVPIFSNVIYNLEQFSQASMDGGKARSARDVLQIADYPNARFLAPVVRLACIYDLNDAEMHDGNRSNAINNDQILRHAEFLSPEINKSINFAKGCKHHLKPSVIGFCHYVFSKHNPALADDFMHRLITGEDLTTGNPVMTLRDLLIESKVDGVIKLQNRKQIALFFKAWNAFVAGASLFSLEWDEENEAFPKVR